MVYLLGLWHRQIFSSIVNFGKTTKLAVLSSLHCFLPKKKKDYIACGVGGGKAKSSTVNKVGH